jgi:hypothetical protein
MPTPYRRYLLIASLLFITYYVFIRIPQTNEDELVVVRLVSDESDERLDYDQDVLQPEQEPVFQRQKDIIKQGDKMEWVTPEEAPHSSKDEAEPQFVRRIVAIGDLHGDLPNAMKVLRMTRVIDERGNWSGDVDFLVQTGDIIGTPFIQYQYSLISRAMLTDR